MKIKLLIPIFLLFFLGSCSKSDEKLKRNPYLSNPVVSVNLNLNLPEYNPLKFPGNYVIIPQGLRGIVVYCATESLYLAFELSDPNHVPNNCSGMEVDGIIATCPCPTDENSYYIVNGLHTVDPDTKYPMQQYRAERTGNSITIRN